MAENPGGEIGQRKAEHLEICVDADRYSVETGDSMMRAVSLVHRSLPEMDSDSVDPSTQFLGHTVGLPVFISSMTGGSSEAFKRNKDLARVAQESRIPVGMGSIRILFRNPEVIDHFLLKKIAPDVPVFANIGGVQLRENTHSQLIELLKRLEVDAVAVHLNPGQELAQPGGDRNFSGILEGIRGLCEQSPVPVMVKETGFGIAPDEAERLVEAGAAYVDVAGTGGTNWMTVEGFRLSPEDQAVIEEFGSWGLPTAAVLAAFRMRETAFHGKLLASGGLRTGMDAVKSIALGAESAGMALPFIRAVSSGGTEAGLQFVQHLRQVVQTAMALTGCTTISDLQTAPVHLSRDLEHLAQGLAGLHRL